MGGDSGELFSTAKNAIMGFSRSLAVSLAPEIRVNCIAPGFITTPMTDALSEQQRADIDTKVPVGRMGTPDEIAAGALFLASDEAAYVTGHTLVVDGGLTC